MVNCIVVTEQLYYSSTIPKLTMSTIIAIANFNLMDDKKAGIFSLLYS